MLRFRKIHLLWLLPVMAAVAILPGCDNGAVVSTGKVRPPSDDDGGAEIVRVPLVPASYGTITGKVIYDGTPSDAKTIPSVAGVSCCIVDAPDSETKDQQWIVDKNNKGVKNAVVFLQPPSGKFFKLKEGQEKPKGDVTIEQPRFAFIPRVFVLFPSYYDVDDKGTAAQKPTNQRLVITNEATCEHNFKLIPGGEGGRPFNQILKRGDKKDLTVFVPDSKPTTVMCDIHNWMRAYGFIFLEHPYAAVTKDDGTFVIENVPVGVDLQVVGWHEAAGFFNGGEDGKKMKLQDKQELDTFKVKGR